VTPILGNDYGGVGIVARVPRKVKRVSPGSMVIYGTPHRWSMPCILVVNPSFHAKRGTIASIERGVQSVAVKREAENFLRKAKAEARALLPKLPLYDRCVKCGEVSTLFEVPDRVWRSVIPRKLWLSWICARCYVTFVSRYLKSTSKTPLPLRSLLPSLVQHAYASDLLMLVEWALSRKLLGERAKIKWLPRRLAERRWIRRGFILAPLLVPKSKGVRTFSYKGGVYWTYV